MLIILQSTSIPHCAPLHRSDGLNATCMLDSRFHFQAGYSILKQPVFPLFFLYKFMVCSCFFFWGLQSRLSISLALPFPSSIPQDIFFSENLGCYSLTVRPISKQLSNERPSNVKDHLSESCDHHLVVLEKLRYVLFRIHPLHTHTHIQNMN